MLQIALTLVIFLVLVIPMGTYMYHIATKQRTFADPLFDRLDGGIYKVLKISREGMNWKQYALHLLITNAVMVLVGYVILRLQGVLFANPNGIEAMDPTLSFNTIISFMTNTNLQHYAGESGLSYLSQMTVIIFMMFVSAASGYSACMAFCRGLAGKQKDVGNFHEDMIRVTTRILIPFSIIIGILLIWQGVPQTLDANQTIKTLEGNYQDLAMGPVAALESIKHLGTNGGGFFGANSSMPFENPTIISNLIELLSMMILPGACVVTFGEKKREEKNTESAFGKSGKNNFCSNVHFILSRPYFMFPGRKSRKSGFSAGGSKSGRRKYGRKGNEIWRCTVGTLYDNDYIIYNRYGQQHARLSDTFRRSRSYVTYDAELCVWR